MKCTAATYSNNNVKVKLLRQEEAIQILSQSSENPIFFLFRTALHYTHICSLVRSSFEEFSSKKKKKKKKKRTSERVGQDRKASACKHNFALKRNTENGYKHLFQTSLCRGGAPVHRRRDS